jgi:hypothetical protein
MGISAVLITKNEEAVIARCIKSLLGVDEVVILDTGSDDKTVEVAEKLGAKVKRRESAIVPFHFAQARNEAMALASNNWIFSIDADECLRPGAIRKLRKAVSEAGEQTAFVSTFVNHAGSGASKSVVTQKIKLFKPSEWEWKYRVHEQLVARNPENKKVGILEDVVVEHIPEPDKSRRHGQNVELLKLCIQESPEYARAHRHLGQELMLQKAWREAIPHLARYVEITEEDALQKSEATMHVGRCYAESGGLDEGLKWFEMAFRTDPRRREPLYHAALHLIKACRLEEAEDFAKRMMDVPAATRPRSSLDIDDAWSGTPLKMYMFCKTEIARAKAEYEARNS